MIYLSITLALIAGGLYVTGFAPFNLWLSPIISLAVLAICLKEKKHWEGALIGLLFGLGMMGLGVSWIYNSISTYSTATDQHAILVTASFCFAMALFYAAHGFLYCWLNFNKRTIFTIFYSALPTRVFSFAALWTLLELIRSHLYIGFPWLLLGEAMIDSPLAAWAPLGGTFLVSFIAVLSSICFAYSINYFSSIYVRRDQYRVMVLVLVGLVPWIIGGRLINYNWNEIGLNPISVAVVQGNIEQNDKWDPNYAEDIIGTYKRATYRSFNSDLIVWPEAATPYVHPRGGAQHSEIAAKVKKNNSELIYGGLRRDRQNRFYNSIFTVDDDGDILHVYDKNILVPFGEYIPMAGILSRLPGGLADLDMSSFITNTGGKSSSFILAGLDIRVAPSICYEVTHGSYIASLALDSNLLVSISNDAWFGDSIGPHQHMHSARARALENQRYLIRASNNGISAIVNRRGKIVKQLDQFKKDTLYGEVYASSGKTPYQYVFDFPMWGLCVLGLVFCMIRKNTLLNKI